MQWEADASGLRSQLGGRAEPRTSVARAASAATITIIVVILDMLELGGAEADAQKGGQNHGVRHWGAQQRRVMPTVELSDSAQPVAREEETAGGAPSALCRAKAETVHSTESEDI